MSDTTDIDTGATETAREDETMGRDETLTGYEAVEAAERGEVTLAKYADPIEDARDEISVDEARAVAAEDPSLIYAVRA